MAPAFDARGRHPIRPHPPSARQCQEHWYLAVNYLYLFFLSQPTQSTSCSTVTLTNDFLLQA